MPRELKADRAHRLSAVLETLRRTYPDAHCELVYKTPLELLVATILSAQCTDKQVNIVTQNLFKKYRLAEDFAHAPLEQLEMDIKRIGLFRSKAKNIKACCQKLLALHHGQVPQSMEALTALAGVGRKTANVVLGNAFQITVGIVVDTHVARLAKRLGFTRMDSPEKIEADLIKMVPKKDWTLFSHWLIFHGRRRCHARKPDCPQCEIQHLCPSNTRAGESKI